MAERERLTLWFSPGEMADLDRFAAEHGVTTGAAARLAVIRGFHQVCRDASTGRVKLRARSVSAPVRGRALVEPPVSHAPAAPPSSGVNLATAVPRNHAEAELIFTAALQMMGAPSRAELARRPR